MRHGPRRQYGTTLMEAMVAVLLLSMCALGYAALQLRGLSANSSSMWRSKATLLAADMSDRMRANRAGVAGGFYNSLTSATAVTDCGTTVLGACTPTKMAQLDHWQWSAALARELPGSNVVGVVCIDSTPDDGTAGAPACDGSGQALAVKVFWQERGTETRLAVAVRP